MSNLLLDHPDIADLVGRDGGIFAKLADKQIKYGVEPHHRAANADDYGRYLDLRVWRKREGKWVDTKPRMTCTCGKNVAQKIDGTPWAHACKEATG